MFAVVALPKSRTEASPIVIAHFKRINEHLDQEGSSVRYKFTFLTPASFNKFLQSLRDGTIVDFRSELDVRLVEEV